MPLVARFESMSPKKRSDENWLPADVDLDDAREVLQDPNHLDFYRILGKLLDHTTSLEEVTEFVDRDVLLREFAHVQNHMRHGRLTESNRDAWKQRIAELRKTTNGERPDSSSDQSPSRKDPSKASSTSGDSGTNRDEDGRGSQESEEVIEEPPPSAVSTEQTEPTQKARSRVGQEREMMGGVEENVGVEGQVSESSQALSEELRQLRKKRDVTRNELAEASGISLQQLSELERGRTEMTYDLLKQYVEGLGMDLDLDFTERDESSGELLEQIKAHIDETIESMDLPEELARHSRIVLHQIAEDGLHRKRLPTLRDALNYVETAVKQFSIREDAPDPSIFSNDSLYEFLKTKLKDLDYSDMAYDENVKIVGQKMLERFHN